MGGDSDDSLLTRIRKRKDVSQAFIAEKLGVTQPTIHNWELGLATPPPSKWKAIARVYGLTMADLFELFGKSKAKAS